MQTRSSSSLYPYIHKRRAKSSLPAPARGDRPRNAATETTGKSQAISPVFSRREALQSLAGKFGYFPVDVATGLLRVLVLLADHGPEERRFGRRFGRDDLNLGITAGIRETPGLVGFEMCTPSCRSELSYLCCRILRSRPWARAPRARRSRAPGNRARILSVQVPGQLPQQFLFHPAFISGDWRASM